MDTIDLCQAGALLPFVRCLDRRGIPTARYLEKRYIPPELVTSYDAKIIKRQVWRFFEDVERHEGIASLGFLDGDPTNIVELGPLGQTLLKAVTLKDAIDTFSRLVPSFAEGNSCWLQQGKETSWLCVRTRDMARSARVADHYSTIILREVIRLAAGADWEPSRIWLYSDASNSTIGIPQIVNASVRFSQDRTAIAFPSKLLAKSVGKTVSSTVPIESTTHHIESSTSTADALRTVLSSLIKHRNLPTANETAEMIGISRTTLYRVLQAEGTNYRYLSERARFDAACRLLSDRSLSIKQIAFDVGYAHQANFVRAFRQLSGYTPTEFRRLNLDD